MIIFVVGLACMDIVYPLLNKYAIDQFFTKKDFSTVKNICYWLYSDSYWLWSYCMGIYKDGWCS